MRASTFKAVLRLVVFILAVGFIFLVAHLQNLGDSYGAIDYFTYSVAHWNLQRPHHHKPATGKVGDKIIVMAKMEHEDTTWVAEELPEYVGSPKSRIKSQMNCSDPTPAGNRLYTRSTPLPVLQTSFPQASTRVTSPWLISPT